MMNVNYEYRENLFIAMTRFIRLLGDEDIIDEWNTYVLDVDADDSDIKELVRDNKEYSRAKSMFKNAVKYL